MTYFQQFESRAGAAVAARLKTFAEREGRDLEEVSRTAIGMADETMQYREALAAALRATEGDDDARDRVWDAWRGDDVTPERVLMAAGIALDAEELQALHQAQIRRIRATGEFARATGRGGSRSELERRAGFFT